MTGTAAHQGHAHALLGEDGLLQAKKPLLRRLPSHVDEQEIFGMTVGQPVAHLRVYRARGEEICVHATFPPANPLEAMFLQFVAHVGGSAEVDVGAVVQAAHVAPQKRVDEAEAEVFSVAGHVRVVGGEQGQVQPAGDIDAKRAQHHGVDGVDDVGLELLRHLPDAPAREVDAQFWIKGNRRTAHAHDLGAGELSGPAWRAEQDDLMPLFVEPAQHELKNADDAVDLRQKGFGEDGDAKVRLLGWHKTTPELGGRDRPNDATTGSALFIVA